MPASMHKTTIADVSLGIVGFFVMAYIFLVSFGAHLK